MSTTATRKKPLRIKAGVYLTDGRELVQIVSVRKAGVRIENVVTLEPRLVQPNELVNGWREVQPRPEQVTSG